MEEVPSNDPRPPLQESGASISGTHPCLLIFWIAVLGFFFANLEIQIEGPVGWAGGLPTWRIENHWLLDIFWGGRPMTGYHAWAFSFMALVFHLPVFIFGHWSVRYEARIIGSLMLFWIVEDFLWFVMNPQFGLAKFLPASIPWHKSWCGPVPTDYVTFTLIGGLLFLFSFSRVTQEKSMDFQ